MNVLSDSESSDSDAGRRFKTESTRNPRENVSDKSRRHGDHLSSDYEQKRSRHYRSKSRSKSPSRNRSRSREHRRRSDSRERSHRKYDKYESAAEKSSKRHDSRERKQNEREKDKERERERERERDKERSSYQRGSSKSSEKHRSHHKRSHSKPSTSDEKTISYKKGSPSSNSITTADTGNSIEKHKKHKKDKDRDRDRDRDKDKEKNRDRNRDGDRFRDERPNKSTDHEHSHKSNEKQSDIIESAVRGSSADDIRISPESNGNTKSDEIVDESLICGPSLPPHMQKIQKRNSPPKESSTASNAGGKTYGPTLPRDFNVNAANAYIAPAADLAAEEISDSDDDDGLIGPVLDHISNKSEAYLELEKRALELKLAKLNECEQKDVGTVREEWMTELPELRKVADMGLTARQFRTKEREEIKDRSSWTDTPLDREERKRRQKEGTSHDDVVKMRHQKSEKLYRERRDAEQEEVARKHKKKHKRDESLLEMHQKKMKKKHDKKPEQPTERRPFSRDTDLQVNRFDEAQKKSILKKAQLLDTRFGSGQSKYL